MELFEFLWVRNEKICHFLVEPANWYRYRKWVTVPIAQRVIGTGTKSWGSGTHSPERNWYRY